MMKVLLDTSSLVAAMVESHPHHGRAFPWLKKARTGALQLVVACHALAELYAVLTSLPVSPRIAPATAWRLIKDNILPCAQIVALSAADYRTVLSNLAELGISGGATYDALIARAAKKANVEKILTLNAGDFSRVAPDMAGLIQAP